MVTSSVPLCLNRFPNLSMTIDIWNSQIREAVNQNNAQKALFIFRQMKQNGIKPNNFTFPFISKACANMSNLDYSKIIHTHIVKSPFCSNIFVQTAMLDMYMKCHQPDIGYKLFVEMPKKDVASWNVMLMGFAQMGILDGVFHIFQDMRSTGILPDSVTIMATSQAISCINNLELAKGVHSLGIRIGIDFDVSVANTWISLYAKCGDLEMAESIFNRIEVGLRSLVSWNSMIAGYAYLEKFFDALNTYKLMLRDGFFPDISTIVSLLSSCVQPETMFQGRQVHSHGIRFGCDSDIHVVNTLISMYSKCGDVYSARCLFDSTCNRSCVTWTAMISGYAEKGDMDEALTLFNAMEAAVCNALIDMYAKCGSINDAWDLFNTMPDGTVVSWTTMIAGCALNGLFEEALNLFYRMIELELKPNHITFLAILQACTHGGFLEKGWKCFNMMTKIYKINPGLDHYSSMVDLLGRKGKLKEALKFIQDMPIKPDTAIWSVLLSACKIHRNIEIGEYAAHHLFEIEPNVSFPYVEMANIYASAGRWDGVARIRTMMKSNRVRKSPGQSLVEVNGKSYAFTVEDRGHFDGEVIYAVLDGLMLQSKEEVSCVIHIEL
ncbi:pentatricopeptide repeat-containing protein At4g19191, mitochondrial isoform X2 [Jatropha curcas]|uniref:pentatricopeptide repeat-containing protein At4g19191, mitochondrial isoform X2 n=1 Tax=Jatropha curcas TaxID=180498 RepID=UPI00189527C0|nr:pentatricopeptide repeat-containing protein At4g19191, mitochondrial isoform X2 [Jatropha curcas]